MSDIRPSELHRKLQAGEKIVLVDVREPYEHEEFNIGGQLIPLGEIPRSGGELKQYEDSTIVLYCRSGNRSAMAQKMLSIQHGIQNTLNLRGGIIAWREENG